MYMYSMAYSDVCDFFNLFFVWSEAGSFSVAVPDGTIAEEWKGLNYVFIIFLLVHWKDNIDWCMVFSAFGGL